MSREQILQKIKGLAQQVCEREGCKLYDAELIGGGKSRILRVFIDKAETSVSVDDCANVSHGLSLLLDAENILSDSYSLEVSSPGLERTLRESWHFQTSLGKKISVKTKEPLLNWNAEYPSLQNRRQLTAELKSVDAEQIILNFEGQEVKVPFSGILKSHVVFDFDSAKQVLNHQ